MGRQRMINDSFRDDPDLTDYTVETRFALMMFLTCPESNIIGVYRVNWKSWGAGIGWTREQTINVARLLADLNGVGIHEDTGWVWVKEWWKHNSIRGAFTGNVAKKALQELSQVPDFWKTQVLEWVKTNDVEGACKGLISPLVGAGGNPNPISIPNSTPTPTLEESAPQRAGVVDNIEIDELVDAAEWQAKQAGTKIGNWLNWRTAVRARFERGELKPEDSQAWKEWQRHQASMAQQAQKEKEPPRALDPHRLEKLRMAAQVAGVNYRQSPPPAAS